MTEAELLEAVREALAAKDNPEGFYTTPEWCEILGVGCEKTVRRKLGELKKLGKLEHGRVNRERINGVVAPFDAYRFIP